MFGGYFFFCPGNPSGQSVCLADYCEIFGVSWANKAIDFWQILCDVDSGVLEILETLDL